VGRGEIDRMDMTATGNIATRPRSTNSNVLRPSVIAVEQNR
jgi:hypothetical protein